MAVRGVSLVPVLVGTLAMCTSLAIAAGYQHVIVLDPQQSECPSKWPECKRCQTLNCALKDANESGNSTLIFIEPGMYKLEADPERNVTDFESVSRLAIIGNSTGLAGPEVTVVCQHTKVGVGFSFIRSQDLEIVNISFTGCGVKRIGTSRNFANQSLEFLHFFVAFYFLYCRNVLFSGVKISHSYGIAVQTYATVGNVTFSGCNFTNNTVNVSEVAGGGALYVEFPYCEPGDENCGSGPSNISREFSEDAAYTIKKCVLANNTAHVNTISNISFVPFIPHGKDHWAFGRGGGLSVFLKGSTQNVSIVVEECEVTGNTALWGGGVFVEFQDNTTDSEFTMRRTVVEENHCYVGISYGNGTGGGGIRLGYIFYNDSTTWSSRVHDNRIRLESCEINRNDAYWGGGVAFYAAREIEVVTATNKLEFVECKWSHNTGVLGFAVDVTVWHSVTHGARVLANFTNCTFYDNNMTQDVNYKGLVGVGSFFSDTIPVAFHGYTNFTDNGHSALAATSTSLDFMDNCRATFFNNSGKNGGAIALTGYAFIRVHNNTNMKFIGNYAYYRGGAIHSESVSEHDITASGNCFLRFSDINATPWLWNSQFFFKGNCANNRNNSIYVTTLLPCLFGGSYGPSEGSRQKFLDKVFCWTENWNYGGNNCIDEITTAPANFNGTYNISVYSGRWTQLPVVVLDDHKKEVTEPQVFGLHSLSNNIKPGSRYVTNNNVALSKTYNGSSSAGSFSLETASPRMVTTNIAVKFLSCPPGFVENNTHNLSRCVCSEGYGELVDCSMDTFSAKLQDGAWMGTVENHSSLVAGHHPHSPGSLFIKYFTLPNDSSKLDAAICARVHRTGVLCGNCKEGYSPGFNTAVFNCVECSSTQGDYYWVFYILAKFVPLTVLLVLTLVFRISVTSGPANSFIFFAQILVANFNLGGNTVKFVHVWEIDSAGEAFRALYIAIYGLANLNFFDPFLPGLCISPGLNSLMVISFIFLVAVYPLVFLLVIYVFAHLYDRGVGFIVCICRPIHRCFAVVRRKWDLQSSLIHCFTTFIIVSYSKFILACFFFLIPTRLYDEQGNAVGEGRLYFNGNVTFLSWTHVPYFIVALCVMVVFVCFLPLLLLVYPLKALEKLSRCCVWIGREPWKPGPKLLQLLDAFQGCYKDGHRYFAGLYLIFRIVIFIIVLSTTPHWFLQYVLLQLVFLVAILLFSTLRPYKVDFYNYVDVVIFVIMAAMTTLLFFTSYQLTYTSDKKATWPDVVLFILIYTPLVYMVSYVVYVQFFAGSQRWLALVTKVHGILRACFALGSDGHLLRGENDPNYSSIPSLDSSTREFDLRELSERMREQAPYRPLRDTF